MAPGNNGGSTTPEDDDPFGYLYADGQAAGATPPEGAGGGYGYPNPRSSYRANQIRTVGERQYGQTQPTQAYQQPNAHYQAPETMPGGGVPSQPGPPTAPMRGGGRGRGPNTKALLIGAVAVVAAVVIGIGVAGSTAKSLAAACDEFESYDSLPGVARPAPEAPAEAPKTRASAKAKQAAKPKRAPKLDEQGEATQLLERALRLGQDKADADEWLHSSAVKTHMRRMDPSFSEKALGYRSFSDFLKSRDTIAELSEDGHERLVRLLER